MSQANEGRHRGREGQIDEKCDAKNVRSATKNFAKIVEVEKPDNDQLIERCESSTFI